MICPKCGNSFNTKTRYNPTTKQNDLPFITYMHTYTLTQILNNQDTCRCSLKKDIREMGEAKEK